MRHPQMNASRIIVPAILLGCFLVATQSCNQSEQSPPASTEKSSPGSPTSSIPAHVQQQLPSGQSKEMEYNSNGSHICKLPERQTSSQAPAEKSTLIGYSTGKSFFPLIVTTSQGISVAKGEDILGIEMLYKIRERQKVNVRAAIEEDLHSKPPCVIYGVLESASEDFTLYASAADAKINIAPSESDIKLFYQLNTACVVQGDPPGENPPCTKPGLLATSDLNANHQPEFWYTDPYIWGTSFTVAEADTSTKKLNEIVSACFFCSD